MARRRNLAHGAGLLVRSDPDDPLSDDALTADFRVLQRVRGHRYSLDDVLTAFVAAERAPEAAKILDLGSGIGSVALMLAWKLRGATVATIEAQEVSHALQLRNIERNGVVARVIPVLGDFRDAALRRLAGDAHDLVTGTPPYFPADATLASSDPQRAHARVELRGGIEAYLEAAADRVREGGVVVVCADARRPERVMRTAPALGLRAERELVVHPRAGKPPLFSVWTLVRDAARAADASFERACFVARTEDGARTDAQREIRAFFGLALDDRRASPPERARRGQGASA